MDGPCYTDVSGQIDRIRTILTNTILSCHPIRWILLARFANMMSRSRKMLAAAVFILASGWRLTGVCAQEVLELPTPSDSNAGSGDQVHSVITEGGESLQEAWVIALSVDPDLEASRWQASAAQRGLYAARAERLPSISASGSYSVYDNPLTLLAPVPAMGPIPPGTIASVTANQREFFLGGVQVTQPLYTFGRISSAIDSAGAEVTAAVADRQSTELDIKLQVAQAYVGVLKAQRLLEVATGSVRSLDAHQREVKDLVDQGVGIRANLLAVQVALANAQQFRLQIQNLLTVSQAAYNRTLQRPLDAAVEVQDLSQPTQEHDLDLSMRQALGRRPEIGFLSAKVRALRSQAKSIHAGKKPQIVLDGGYNFIENRFLAQENYNHVAVQAEWNFWDAGRKGHRAAQLEQSAEALLRKRSHLESMITLQVKKAWHSLDSAQQQIDVNQRGLESADENLRVSKNRYQAGEGTNTEVLDAQTLRTQAYSNYYSSLYDSVLAEMQLLRAVGNL